MLFNSDATLSMSYNSYSIDNAADTIKLIADLYTGGDVSLSIGFYVYASGIYTYYDTYTLNISEIVCTDSIIETSTYPNGLSLIQYVSAGSLANTLYYLPTITDDVSCTYTKTISGTSAGSLSGPVSDQVVPTD